MKIVFSMRHSGALRNFASTVEELARRGHRIHLIFMRRDKLGESRLLHELASAYPAITSAEPHDKVVAPVDRSRPHDPLDWRLRPLSGARRTRMRTPCAIGRRGIVPPSIRRRLESPAASHARGAGSADAHASARRTGDSGRSVRARRREEVRRPTSFS